MTPSTSPNWYDTLELSPRASPPLIKAAYRCLVQQHHPDKNPGVVNAGARLAQINQAYAVLSDPQQRLVYDRSLSAVNRASERRDTKSIWRNMVPPLTSGLKGMRLFAFRPLP